MQHQGGQYGQVAQTTQPTSSTLMCGTAGDNQIVEAASPISSRPPAGNLDELMRDEEDAGDRGRSGGGGSGNRWPKQETLALLKIRSEMDAAFKDAPLKAPLWEDVSRKLAELGYKRNAKKCKEKFENVHKYYKRTKEGRAGRQDGKSYKFFTELQALHTNTSTAAISNVSASLAMAASHVNTNPIASSSTNFVPLGVGINAVPMPTSSAAHTTITFTPQIQVPSSTTMFPTSMTAAAPIPAQPSQAPAGISFSSCSASSSHYTEDDHGGDEEMEEGSSRKRKRGSMSKRGGGGTKSIMEFFESLMRQVMQKQETMQQRFLEVIEKREQDRMIREEAWKRQELARLTRENEIMAHERASAAQRDATIMSFIQKITGQTIQLPQHVSVGPSAPAAPPPAQPAPAHTTVQAAPLAQHHHQRKQQQPPQQQVVLQQIQLQYQVSAENVRQTSSRSTDVVMAVPEQQVPPQEATVGGSFEQSSSRWPKAEVLALINIRSGLEYRYQEAVPKGPLWEEVSAGMARLGYKRNPKRCKEKWENINKYYKKVKESNKKRPEDAKTCPYFHQLDALYRQKLPGNTSGAGGSSSTIGFGNEKRPQQQPQDSIDFQDNTVQAAPPSQAAESEDKNQSSDNIQASNVDLRGSLVGVETGGAPQKELMNQQQQPQNHQQLTVDDYEKVDDPDHSDDLGQDEYDDEDEDDNEEVQEQKKMTYKIEFQRQSNPGPPSKGGNGTPSLAMFQ